MRHLPDRLRAWNRAAQAHAHGYMVGAALVVGLGAGLGAVGFRELIEGLQHLFWGGHGFALDWVRSLPWYHVVLAPALGGLLVGAIVHYGAREAKGHGVPEVMEAVALKGGRIRPRVVGVKALASSITIASGGSVGREGPIAQIGAAIGSTLGQVLQLSTRRLRTLAGCGAAAGIAATFNAPIAGVLFAVEVLLRDLRFSQFSPLVVASVVATAVSREMLGNVPAFVVPAYALESPWELVGYAALGLIAAVLGVVFVRALYGAEDLFAKVRVHPAFLAAMGGAAVGALALLAPEVLGNGYEAIEEALLAQPPWTWLAWILVAKLAAVCLTLGTGGSGGVFAPSLVLGAAAGGGVGIAMNMLFPGLTGPVGAYALVGMGAVVAATTHAPLTASIILFELTGDYRIILPLLIACTLGTLLSAHWQPESIYTMKLVRRGVNLHGGRDVNVLRSVPASSIMRSDLPVLPAQEPLLELLADLAHEDAPAYFVQEADGRFVGTLVLQDLRPVLGDIESCKDLITAADLADRQGKPLAPEDSLDTALARMQAAHRDVWPVTRDERLVGCVVLEDLLETYRREIFKRDMAQGMSDAFSSEDVSLRTVGGYVVTEVDAPRRFAGRSVADLDLRRTAGVTILVVKRASEGEEDVEVPSGETVIQDGDRLVLMGRERAVRALGA